METLGPTIKNSNEKASHSGIRGVPKALVCPTKQFITPTTIPKIVKSFVERGKSAPQKSDETQYDDDDDTFVGAFDREKIPARFIYRTQESDRV
ncbi:hypothetical protein NECAME_13865 [Necator americanus]|uniref:Uncharacterized protein n=1 Tax=Necator americanus TaxID=51031 RepID=W2SUT7_NECAM|nr:hypothetical protein NECAME_13865 [Necator americanus]ETN72467.1 hypothetical protein NECAME_13865 [Necator americanus]